MKIVSKEFLRALGLGVIIFIVLYLIAVAGGRPLGWNDDLPRQFLFVMLYTIMLHLGNMVVFIVIDRMFQSTGLSIKRLLVGFISSFVVSLIIVFTLRVFEDIIIEGKTFFKFFDDERISNYYVAMIITLVITFSLHLFHFYKKYQENRVKQQKIITC
jgi:hypothetical protein